MILIGITTTMEATILIMVTAIILTMVMVITPMDITTEAITIEDTMIAIIV